MRSGFLDLGENLNLKVKPPLSMSRGKMNDISALESIAYMASTRLSPILCALQFSPQPSVPIGLSADIGFREAFNIFLVNYLPEIIQSFTKAGFSA